jgi:hypothetical protein
VVENYVLCVLQMLNIMLKYLQYWWMTCLCDWELTFHSSTLCHLLEMAGYVSLMHKHICKHKFKVIIVLKLPADVILLLCCFRIVPVSWRLVYSVCAVCILCCVVIWWVTLLCDWKIVYTCDCCLHLKVNNLISFLLWYKRIVHRTHITH